MNDQNTSEGWIRKNYRLIIGICAVLAIALISTVYFREDSKTEVLEPITNADPEAIENGIHIRTGFKEDVGLQAVITNCTNCHSAELVTQNRMTKEGWLATIRWMQKSQNLWDLGANEEVILDYLAKNYAPEDKGRREALTNIEWYELKD